MQLLGTFRVNQSNNQLISIYQVLAMTLTERSFYRRLKIVYALEAEIRF